MKGCTRVALGSMASRRTPLHVMATIHRRFSVIRCSLLCLVAAAATLGAQAQRPMTFLDAQNMRQASGPELSPDGRTMLYTLSTADWAQARRQSDVYLVSVDRGVPSTRQLTF